MMDQETSMFRSKIARLFLGCTILISFVGCDQATKHIASRTLQNVSPKSYLGDSVRLSWKSRLTVFVPIALILAGGIGNLIDRMSNQQPIASESLGQFSW